MVVVRSSRKNRNSSKRSTHEKAAATVEDVADAKTAHEELLETASKHHNNSWAVKLGLRRGVGDPKQTKFQPVSWSEQLAVSEAVFDAPGSGFLGLEGKEKGSKAHR